MPKRHVAFSFGVISVSLDTHQRDADLCFFCNLHEYACVTYAYLCSVERGRGGGIIRACVTQRSWYSGSHCLVFDLYYASTYIYNMHTLSHLLCKP